MKLLSTVLTTIIITILINTSLVHGVVKNTVEINKSTINGPVLNGGDFYGVSVAGLGLLDGDSVPDLAVGAYYAAVGGFRRGTVHIHFMNNDGSIKSVVEINSLTVNGPILINSDYYGCSVANLGMLDGDAVNDIAVGAYGDDAGGSGRGAVHIHFMNNDGSVKSTVEINNLTTNGPATLTDASEYSTSIAGLGLFNPDGIEDIAVGAPRLGIGGAIFIHFLNSDGSVISTAQIDGTTPNGPSLILGDGFGRSMCSLGDLDGDTVTDIAVGAYADNTGGGNRGAVYILFMNNDGSVKSTTKIDSTTPNGPVLTDGDNYGNSIINLGDANYDTITDIAVGAHSSDIGGPNRGAVYIHYLNTDGSVISTDEINSTTPNGPVLDNGDRYARGLGALGDLDGDAMPDLVGGAYYADTSSEGKAFIHFLDPPATLTVTPISNNTSTTTITPTPSITITSTPTPTRTPAALSGTMTITPTQTRRVIPSLLSNILVYPNPFNVANQQAIIQYVLNQDADMVVTIYNYLGSTIKTINIKAGNRGGQGLPQGQPNQVEWDGKNSRGQLQAAGGYICQIVAKGSQTKQVEKAVLKIALIR